MSSQPESGADYARDLRKRKSRGLLVVSAIMAVAAVVWLCAWLIGALLALGSEPSVAVVLLIVAVLGALVFGGVAYGMFRVARPPPFPGEIAIDPDEPRRGERVRVRLVRHGATHAGEGCEVGIVAVERYDVRRTDGDGNTHRSTTESEEFAHWSPIPATIGEETIEMKVPSDAPFSYEGKAVSYRWRAEAKIHRRMRPDRRTVAAFWVRP